MADSSFPRLLLLLLFFCAALISSLLIPDVRGSRLPLQNAIAKEGGGDWRRYMIGSVAPTCTYNECRGCKYRCRAEQVPVEGNDPINSAYHYKCICHR